MKIFDCITYFDEPLLFDLRLNILNEYVDEFIVCEATFTHSGQKKKINFNKNNYPNFKDKITHVIVDEQPKNLFETRKINELNNSLFRLNAAKRIEKHSAENSIENGLSVVSIMFLCVYPTPVLVAVIVDSVNCKFISNSVC